MSGSGIHLQIADEGDVVRARRAGRTLAREIGFRSVDQSRIATAISELTRNVLRYAYGGQVHMTVLTDRPGIEIVVADEGPGIPDIQQALGEGFTTGRGLGIGLPGTRRLVDEMTLDSGPGQGTTVTIRKWLRSEQDWDEGRWSGRRGTTGRASKS